MPDLDLVDETFIAAPPKLVAGVFAERAGWRRFWPDLTLEVYSDRGDAGVRWTVRGALVGTMEVWLEPVLDGTLLHHFLRADLPEGARRRPRDLRRERTRRQLAAKALAFGLKSQLEDGRPPGCAPDLT